MTQLKSILSRLKNPSVLISIASQIVTILMLFHVNVDMTVVTTIITAVCSILVLLGIMSNPTTKSKGYFDDVEFCESCQKESVHTLVNGKILCKECGTDNTPPEIIKN